MSTIFFNFRTGNYGSNCIETQLFSSLVTIPSKGIAKALIFTLYMYLFFPVYRISNFSSRNWISLTFNESLAFSRFINKDEFRKLIKRNLVRNKYLISDIFNFVFSTFETIFCFCVYALWSLWITQQTLNRHISMSVDWKEYENLLFMVLNSDVHFSLELWWFSRL